MRPRPAWLTAAGVACLFFAAALDRVHAQAPSPALTGRVASAEEGPMEGVLVSAQQDGSPITISVVSGADGSFSFPAAKLAAGRYALRIRAVGYELDGPAAAEVPAPKALDLTLRKVTDLAAQLTNTEWFMSMPGTGEQKRPLIECMSCHTFERIMRSKYDADALMPLLKRMHNLANNTTMAKVQPRKVERDFAVERARKVAEYLATINLSQHETWSYELKTLPRPKGRATRVVITEYDMPRQTIAPHDVRLDKAWSGPNFVENTLGRLDPKTGEHREYAYPVLKPGF
jgi:hypothetical protein